MQPIVLPCHTERSRLLIHSVFRRPEIISYPKLGYKNHEGSWTDLLGSVVSETVDIGVESVLVTYEMNTAMFFTFPILQSMRNIYFLPPETSAVRDIFLTPFSSRLLLCVVATGIVIAIVMGLISGARNYEAINKLDNEEVLKKSKCRKMADSFMWTVSVLFMQGSVWNPRRPSGKFLLITSLTFALIMYNAYAAFITSVLSVQTSGIKNLDDLLSSRDYEVGYLKNGQDEAYLRGANDTNLRLIFLRGFVKNTIDSVTDGLMKASKGHFAFFSSAQQARGILSTLSDCRCKVDELQIKSTLKDIAFPMSKNSPYKKLVSLSVMKMRESGTLRRIALSMLPDMPHCEKPTSFKSAQLTDVDSAFWLLIAGIITSFFIWIIECLVKRRKYLRQYLINLYLSCTKNPSNITVTHGLPRKNDMKELNKTNVY